MKTQFMEQREHKLLSELDPALIFMPGLKFKMCCADGFKSYIEFSTISKISAGFNSQTPALILDSLRNIKISAGFNSQTSRRNVGTTTCVRFTPQVVCSLKVEV